MPPATTAVETTIPGFSEKRKYTAADFFTHVKPNLRNIDIHFNDVDVMVKSVKNIMLIGHSKQEIVRPTTPAAP